MKQPPENRTQNEHASELSKALKILEAHPWNLLDEIHQKGQKNDSINDAVESPKPDQKPEPESDQSEKLSSNYLKSLGSLSKQPKDTRALQSQEQSTASTRARDEINISSSPEPTNRKGIDPNDLPEPDWKEFEAGYVRQNARFELFLSRHARKEDIGNLETGSLASGESKNEKQGATPCPTPRRRRVEAPSEPEHALGYRSETLIQPRAVFTHFVGELMSDEDFGGMR